MSAVLCCKYPQPLRTRFSVAPVSGASLLINSVHTFELLRPSCTIHFFIAVVLGLVFSDAVARGSSRIQERSAQRLHYIVAWLNEQLVLCVAGS